MGTATKTASGTWRGKITSHETFTHDSLDSLGYDWGRIADPGVGPIQPLKIYMPQSTEEVVNVLAEARQLGERPVIRSKGHSSNDLVLSDRGSVLLTQMMDRIVDVDEAGLTATVQAGAISAVLDDELAPRGLGLPVIGDHNDITVGGFSSVGGISASAHRYGLFVDNVERLTYVTWDGEVITCSRTERPEHFFRVLTGTGRWGVITEMTLRLLRVDKYRTIWQNDIDHYFNVESFIEGSARLVLDPPAHAMMMRGIYVDLPLGAKRSVGAGQFSVYRETEQTPAAKARNTAAYGLLHGIGYAGGRLPAKLDLILKQVGMASVLMSPRYASIKNVEFFTDKTLESTVGDPTRMLVVLGPLDRYQELFRDLWQLMLDFRARTGALTFISLYVKSIKSDYLARGGPDNRFCEFLYYVGMHQEKMSPAVLDELVREIDDFCLERGCLRYMHTKTSSDPERRRRLDPNTYYADRFDEAAQGNGRALTGAGTKGEA